jgi:hypothetical protein
MPSHDHLGDIVDSPDAAQRPSNAIFGLFRTNTQIRARLTPRSASIKPYPAQR